MEDKVCEYIQNILSNHSLNHPFLLQIWLMLNAFGL